MWLPFRKEHSARYLRLVCLPSSLWPAVAVADWPTVGLSAAVVSAAFPVQAEDRAAAVAATARTQFRFVSNR